MQIESTKYTICMVLHSLYNLSLYEKGHYWLQIYSQQFKKEDKNKKINSKSSSIIQLSTFQSNCCYLKYNNQLHTLNEFIMWDIEVGEKNNLIISLDLIKQVGEQGQESRVGKRTLKVLNCEGFLEYQQITFNEPYSILLEISIMVLPIKIKIKKAQEQELINKIKKHNFASFICESKILNGDTNSIQAQKESEITKKKDRKFLSQRISLEIKQQSFLESQLDQIAENNEKLTQKFSKLIQQNKFNFTFLIQEYHRLKMSIYKEKIIKEESLIKLKDIQLTYKFRQNKLDNLKQQIKEGAFTKTKDIFMIIPDKPKKQFHQCPIIFHQEETREHIKKQSLSVRYKNLFIIAHGYQGTPRNMERVKIGFKSLFRNSRFLLLGSYQNQMDNDIEEMGRRAAQQIQEYFQSHENLQEKGRIIMVGHSMGGIVLRASLKYLSIGMKKMLHTYISMGVPHLGYFSGTDFCVEKGLNLINFLKPILSLKQLSGKDSKHQQQTFIYKLSKQGSLSYFENIVLLSSLEDKYVPWYSSRIQVNKKKLSQQNIQRKMIQNILTQKSQIAKIYRADIDFPLQNINFDTMIGRAAHIAYLTDEHFIQMLLRGCFNDLLKILIS